MSERYRRSLCMVQIKSSVDNTVQRCRKLAKAEASRLAAASMSIRTFERATGERSNEEILIIADLGHVVPRIEPVNRPDGRGDTCSVQRTIFRRIGSDFGSIRTERMIAGLLLIESRCSDPECEAEWHHWYNTVHVPDMLGSGLYHTAYRFEIANRIEGRGHYLALYETDLQPTEAHRSFWEEFRPKWIASGRVISTMQVTSAVSYAATTWE